MSDLFAQMPDDDGLGHAQPAHGVRVISQRGMSKALGRHATGSGSSSKTGAEPVEGGVAKLPNFLAAANLKPFIDPYLSASLRESIEEGTE